MSNELNPKPASFRAYLQEELLQRCRKNRGYSLRSFAKTLELNPASLSRMLRGERAISPEMRDRLAARLGLGPAETAALGLESPDTLSSVGAGAGARAPMAYHELTLDAFAVIADWYHYAILELTQIRSFEPSAAWVAQTLGITVNEARIAVERLQRLELLEVTASGQWRPTQLGNTNIAADLRAGAHRRLQRQILELALRALDETPLERRDQSSMTMAADSSLLPEAAQKITDFRRELCSFLESGKKRDVVYQLSVSLFPLTNPNLQSSHLPSKPPKGT